ncbi:Multidrug resistance protein Stp [Streptomyces sp. RB5]|uniref:Multidrug resistance protein Stp n=1 Tax=Streptomyces smaragdinus TaxID=2585196 RepID=A0A7K0CDK5_9ACTN|nr:MFS transporter [Streptomyces smaragdinus]MQY11530.1 Multidrug resistance protein Stp [Streptomyces smaragdinus]
MTRRRPALILAICCMSLLLVSLDTTAVNVALPTLREEFDASVSGLQWTIDGYAVVLASFLILSGSTGDRVGRRRTFRTGLVVFTLASVLCSLAPGLGWLIAARVLQAVGGSMLNPVAMSIITNTFTEPRERARAIGVWGGVVGISMAAGPLVGGLLVESVGWRSIFWINVPVGLLALALTARFVPESRAPHPRRPDPVGQGLVIVFLGGLTFAIIEAPDEGLGSPLILVPLAAALSALAAFVPYELRRREPLIDPRFFRSAPFTGATLIAVSAFAALAGFLFLNTLYLQEVRGYSPLEAGLWMLPMAAMTMVCAPLSGRLVGSYGPRPPLLVAGPLMAATGVLFAAFTAETSNAGLLVSYILFGIGFGLVNAPITNTAVSGMPVAQAGVAAAVASTSRQTGNALGVAVIGAVLASGLGGGSFTDAARPAWWIVTGCGLTVLATGALTTGRWARTTAARTAALLGSADARPATPAKVP